MGEMLQYVNRDTLLHRMNPLTKFIFFLLMAVTTSFMKNGFALLFLFASLTIIWCVSKIQKEMFSIFAKLKWLMVFIVVLWIVMGAFTQDSNSMVLFHKGIISLEMYDFYKGFLYAIRLFMMVATFFTVIVTTNFSEIILGLRRIKIPYAVAFGIGLVFQMIPIVIKEFNAIMEAQSSRGLEVEKCGVKEKVKNYVTISIPLLFRIIGKGQGISLAMYYYKLNFRIKRTSYKTPVTTYKDFLFIFITVIMVVVSVFCTKLFTGFSI